MPSKVAVKRVSEEPIKRRRARAVSAWILVLIVAGAAFAGEKSGSSLPPPELVGHWRGQGRIVNDWTSVQMLPVDIGIMPDGTIAGTIGYAEIAGGVYLEPKKQSARKPGFTLSVNLDGQLLGDGVMRRAMQLYLTPANGRLTGSGASEGGMQWPGSWRQTKRRTGRLQVRAVSLARVDARSP
ncbi:MAG: hypothetical protein ABSE21_08330 [Bryobacteraceae bacterium]|jgi:hypothetical protein